MSSRWAFGFRRRLHALARWWFDVRNWQRRAARFDFVAVRIL
jgi:Holliday junction resolvase-like predicted endonuclease